MLRQSPRKAAVVNKKTESKPTTKSANGTTSAPVAKAGSKKRKVIDEDEEEEVKEEEVEDQEDEDEDQEESKAAKKRKTSTTAKGKGRAKGKGKAKTENTMPLAERTAISSLKKAMYIGAHVSSAGGVQNSIANAVQIGANAFALFLKSQRKWESPAMTGESRTGFQKLSKQHSYDACKHCLPHGSYLVNLAAPDKAKADQAYKSFEDDLKRCEQLGIVLYNFHPGNTNGEPRDEAIGRIAAQLNRSHKATKTVVTVLENMAGQGNVVGCAFEDLRDIIELVEDKSRVGVCIDTCHAFAAGYDLRRPEAFKETMDKFDKTVGTKYLKAFHLNDSKAPFDSHRDLHANIGTGFLGLRAFHNIMNHPAFSGLPMILETPIDKKGADGKNVEDKQVWADEIKLLESLIGMDADGDEFKALEARLQEQGEGERSKIQDQVDRKAVKDAKKSRKAAKGAKGTKGAKRGRKKRAESNEDEDEDD